MKKRYSAGIALVMTGATALLYNACGLPPKFSAVQDITVVGNPFNPVSSQIMYAICGVINKCNPTATLDKCQTDLLSTSGFAGPLNLPANYSTLSSIIQAEQSDILIGNQAAGANCYDAINTLDCSDPTVQGAFDPTQPNPFVNSPNMIPTASCNRVYAPGVSLEVPIELVDVGVSSNLTATIFSRTRTSLNTTNYDGTVSYSFEVVATNTDTTSRNVSLLDSSGNLTAMISIPNGTSSPQRIRGTFIPTAGASDYRVQLDGTSKAGALSVFEGRVLVKQVGATQTKIYVPLTEGYGSTVVGADDSTGAVDEASQGADYTPSNIDYFSTWMKNDSAFSQLASGQPYTLEAVISTSGAASTTAYVSLFDVTTGNQVKASETSTTLSTPTLVSMGFADSSLNFNDTDNMEVRVRNDGGNDNAWIYRAGLWVTLTNLTHAEVYYRYSGTVWLQDTTHDQDPWQMILFDSSLFSSPISIYHEVGGYLTTAGPSCTEQILDVGTVDSGTSGTAVANSALTFNSTTKTRLRSSPLTLTSGDRFISDTLPFLNGSNNCIIIQPRVTIGF